jgi:hypothetical protein
MLQQSQLPATSHNKTQYFIAHAILMAVKQDTRRTAGKVTGNNGN